MGKIADNIIFGLAVIVVVYSWSAYLIGDARFAIIIAVGAYLAARVVRAFFVSRKKSLKNLSSVEMCAALAVMGRDKSAEYLYNTLPESMRVGLYPPFFVIKKDMAETLVFSNYKFADTTEEDIALLYRKSKELGISKIIVLSRRTDRRVMVLAARLNLHVRFIEKRLVRKYLIEHAAMPENIISDKKIRLPFNIKETLLGALDRRKIKYYIFTGITLFVMSFFTPLKLYYLILSSLPLILAAASAFVSIRES